MRHHILRRMENDIVVAKNGLREAHVDHGNVERIRVALQDALDWTHEMIVDVEGKEAGAVSDSHIIDLCNQLSEANRQRDGLLALAARGVSALQAARGWLTDADYPEDEYRIASHALAEDLIDDLRAAIRESERNNVA